jgi:hypothetical protein
MSTIGWKTTDRSSGETRLLNEKKESRAAGLLSGRGGASESLLLRGCGLTVLLGELRRDRDFSSATVNGQRAQPS